MKAAVARLLGLSEAEAALLLGRARRQLGARGYALRCAAFLAATLPAARLLLPAGMRERAIGPLVAQLLTGSADALGYVELQPFSGERHGRGLVAAPAPDEPA